MVLVIVTAEGLVIISGVDELVCVFIYAAIPQWPTRCSGEGGDWKTYREALNEETQKNEQPEEDEKTKNERDSQNSCIPT